MVCSWDYHSTWAGSVARCVIIIFFLSFPFGRKNNNILLLGTIINNEANVLESFDQIFGMASTYFPEFFASNFQPR
jgi:hypothetical protein